VALSFVFNDLRAKLLGMVCHLIGEFVKGGGASSVAPTALRIQGIWFPALTGWAKF
jgi:hypothetical protein